MIKVIGVRFRKVGKIYYFDPAGVEASVGDSVVAETARGLEMGEVVVGPKQVPEEDVVQPLRKVVRRAADPDFQRSQENRRRETSAYRVVQEKIDKHQLNMKLVDVEMAFDGKRAVCYFTADERVDFRALVKDLAKSLRRRIEMRQIGVRDEAKMLGGYGVCGRELCCATWIGDFEPISIRDAKVQDLSLNPGRISGACGRLKCCLKYEAEMYRELREKLPRVGETVRTPQGEGKVVEVHVIKEELTVLLDPEEGIRVQLKADALIPPEPADAKGPGKPPRRRRRPRRSTAAAER